MLGSPPIVGKLPEEQDGFVLRERIQASVSAQDQAALGSVGRRWSRLFPRPVMGRRSVAAFLNLAGKHFAVYSAHEFARGLGHRH